VGRGEEENLVEKQRQKFRQEAQEVISRVDGCGQAGREALVRSYRRINGLIDRIERDAFTYAFLESVPTRKSTSSTTCSGGPTSTKATTVTIPTTASQPPSSRRPPRATAASSPQPSRSTTNTSSLAKRPAASLQTNQSSLSASNPSPTPSSSTPTSPPRTRSWLTLRPTPISRAPRPLTSESFTIAR
jgi:hypothetical protein